MRPGNSNQRSHARGDLTTRVIRQSRLPAAFLLGVVILVACHLGATPPAAVSGAGAAATAATPAPAQAIPGTPLPTPAPATSAPSAATPDATPATDLARDAATPGAATPAATPTVNSASCQSPQPGAWATCRFTEADGLTMTFYLFVPQNYAPSRRYPLVLLLHGGGERALATNTAAQNRDLLLNDPYAAVWGTGSGLSDDPGVQRRWPSFVVIPQVANPSDYVGVPANQGSYTLPPQPTDSLRMAKEIVDTLQQQYAGIDPARRYVTGLSMGGYAAWEMIERWPGYFAAAAPMCGAGDPSLAARLVDTPIWAFHGAVDPIVPVAGSRDMIAAIEAAGGKPRYTEYPGQGHGVWVYAYSIAGNPTPWLDFYQWLFAQRLGTPAK